MNETLDGLLDRNLPLPGVAACCARLPDRSFITRTNGDWFTAAQLEKAVGRLALAADGFGYHGIQPVRLCWVFERTRIHLALRRDGACLALFEENHPGGTHSALTALLDEFTSLTTL